MGDHDSFDFPADEPLLIAALEHATCGIAVVNDDGILAYLNERYAEIYGYRREELTGKSLAILLSPPESDHVDEVIRGLRLLENETSGERTLRKKDGSEVYVHFTVKKVNSRGKTYSLATLQDIGQLQAVRELAARKEQARQQMMVAALDAVICFGPDRKITFWNPQAQSMFGIDEREAMGETVIDRIFKDPESLSTLPESLGKLHEMTAIAVDGREIPVEITVLSIDDDKGEIYCAYIRDISERRKNERILRDSTWR